MIGARCMYWDGRSAPPSGHLLYTAFDLKALKKNIQKKYKPQIFIGIETNKTLRQVKIETILMTVVVQILALFKSLGETLHIGHPCSSSGSPWAWCLPQRSELRSIPVFLSNEAFKSSKINTQYQLTQLWYKTCLINALVPVGYCKFTLIEYHWSV